MDKHTKGLLAFDGESRIDAVDYRRLRTYTNEDGEKVEYMDGIVALPYGCGDGTHEGNARRLVACWNACDGIPTETLEQSAAPSDNWLSLPAEDQISLMSIARDKSQAKAKLFADQRDELLAALKALSSASRPVATALFNIGQPRKDWSSIYRSINKLDAVLGDAMALIAKVESR